MNQHLQIVQQLTSRISLNILDTSFKILVQEDKKGGQRAYIQLEYYARCSKTKRIETYKGRKWYLSEHMTDDEIVKTVYAAFEMAVKHEVLEGFTVDDIPLFNPHVDFEELLKISHKEVTREQN